MRIKFPYVTLKRRAKIQAMREEITRNTKSWRAMEIMRVTKQEKCSHVIACLDDSKSQIQQDLFALAMNNFKDSGYFVEFGAANGVDTSNTWLMENNFGWKGILAEPARVRHADLKKSRNCHIDTRCVWGEQSSAMGGGATDYVHRICMS